MTTLSKKGIFAYFITCCANFHFTFVHLLNQDSLSYFVLIGQRIFYLNFFRVDELFNDADELYQKRLLASFPVGFFL